MSKMKAKTIIKMGLQRINNASVIMFSTIFSVPSQKVHVQQRHAPCNTHFGFGYVKQESPAVAEKPARRLRKVCTDYVRAVGL